MPQIFLLPGAHSSPQIRFKSAVAILAVEQRLLSYITSQISDPAGGEFLQAIVKAGDFLSIKELEGFLYLSNKKNDIRHDTKLNPLKT